ncbi:MAG: DNA gyrase subunit A [Candidatus Hepatoplasma vulgare]|nr:MAG: DNA gyrase subunit A [Candidatus Hepatoplasma sp.]
MDKEYTNPQEKIDSNYNKNIKEISISDEMEKSFIDYSMSVIVSRAIPDVRDGLKPVHRRILYAMDGLDMQYTKAFKKSARAVGEVIAKYHPHGDTSVYDALVRLAQPFSMRYPLIRGQGNFGSVDGDSAAAMRYTEAKLEKISSFLLEDIFKNTVDFQDNYDNSEREPKVLPGKIPNLLINGSTGIAVGMATSIPPHNITEVLEATKAVIENPQISIEELFDEYLKAPDFPTGGIIVNPDELLKIYKTGRGRVIVRSKVRIEEDENGKGSKIIITEIPYMINKSKLILKIAELVKNKVIDSISDLRDESNRDGIRVVVSIKGNHIPEVELNKLFKLTPLQSNFPVNILAIVEDRPQELDLKKILIQYINHQMTILIRKSKFNLERSKKRKHILEGIRIAIEDIDEIIKIIRSSKNTESAINSLISKFKLDDIQSKAILDMKLQRLTGLEQRNLLDEVRDLENKIENYEDIIISPERRNKELVNMINSMIDIFGDERRTEISSSTLSEIFEEDLIPNENILITMSERGYVKRLSIKEYRQQHRGGKGSKGASISEDDEIKSMIFTNTHTDLLLFSSYGKVYRLKAYQIPIRTKISKGIPLINLISIEKEEKILSLLEIDNYEDSSLVFVTRKGIIKKTNLKEYKLVRKTGKIAIKLKKEDELFIVKKIPNNKSLDIVIGNSNGQAVRFDLSSIRALGRSASGVRAMNIGSGKIVGCSWSDVENDIDNNILSISELGFGKITNISYYRKTKRGAKGVKTINILKAGKLVALKSLSGDEDLMIIKNNGKVIRVDVSKIKKASRNTKGIKIVELDKDEKIMAVTTVPNQENIEKTIEFKIKEKP